MAMQAAGSTDSQVFKGSVMDVANAPGEKIYPGELAKALKLISEGKDVDYVGASAVELIGSGESAGSYAELEVKGGKFETALSLKSNQKGRSSRSAFLLSSF